MTGSGKRLALDKLTATASPTFTTTATPAPDIVIQRSTYSIAGQMVAVRVVGDPDNNNRLFYYYNDHPSTALRTSLGSTAVVVRGGTGAVINGGVARYLPYGAYRTTPTQTVTGRHFTGHKQTTTWGWST